MPMRRGRILVVSVMLASLSTLAMPSAFGAPAPRSGPAVHPLIVGGTPISSADAPWQALILIDRGDAQSLCSGALINPTTILSVAHCLAGVAPGTVKTWLGVTKMSEAKKQPSLPVAGLSVHPGYNPDTLANDIAVIQLAQPVDLTTGAARLIGLPFGQDAASWPAGGTPATVAGWGATATGAASSDQLLRAGIQVLAGPGAACGQYGATFDASMLICGGMPDGSLDTCQGDSGGPFVVDQAGLPILAGLTSNGVDCGSAVYPGLYTRLTSFLPWIQSVADVATAIPGAPTGVAAQAQNGKMTVSWTAPAGAGAASTLWTVTAQPGGKTCRTTASQCSIAGLPAGSTVTFSVQGSGPLGTSPAASSEPSLVATHEASAGSSVGVGSVASWVGLGGGKSRAVSKTKAVCEVAGSKVKLRTAGTCTLQVSKGGKKRTAVIHVV